jgi:hypothetical protein
MHNTIQLKVARPLWWFCGPPYQIIDELGASLRELQGSEVRIPI